MMYINHFLEPGLLKRISFLVLLSCLVWGQSSGLLAQQPCPAPLITIVQDVSATRASVTWISLLPPSSVEYEVWLSEDGRAWQLKKTTSETSSLLTGLRPGTGYLVKVRTKCLANIFSEYTPEEEFETRDSDPPGCSEPLFLSPIQVSSRTAIVSWAFSPNANRYEVEISTDRQNWNRAGEVEALFFTLTDLEPRQTYFIRVRAICNQNETSRYTDILEIRTQETDPPTRCVPVSKIVPFSIGGTSASLSTEYENPDQVPDNQTLLVIYYPIDRPADKETLTVRAFEGIFLTDLRPDTRYRLEVRGICFGPDGLQQTETTSFEFKTDDTSDLCRAPDFVEFISSTPRAIRIGWPEVLGAAGYQVRWSSDFGQTWTTGPITSENSYEIKNLEPESMYWVQVRSICADEKPSDWNFPEFFDTQPDNGCANPIDVSHVQVTDNTARFNWRVEQTEFPVRRYLIEYSDGRESKTVEVTDPHAFLTGLKPGTFYTVGIRSICVDGNGEEILSSEVRTDFRTTGEAPCEAPLFAQVILVSSNRASIFWELLANANSYVVWVRSEDGNYDRRFTSSEPAFELDDLTPLTRYTVRIKAICSGEDSSDFGTPIEFQTEPAFQCRNVVLLRANEITTNSSLITWANTPGATGYEVELYDENNQRILTQIVTEARIQLSNLNPGSRYLVRVRALCRGPQGQPGAGAFADRSFETARDSNPNCPPPQNLRVVAMNGSRVSLAWEGSEQATGYLVEFSTDGGRNWEQAGPLPNRTELQTDELPANVTFLVRIRTICTRDLSEPSNTVEFRINNCPAATNVRVQQNGSQATIRWDAAGPAVQQYRIFLSEDCINFRDVGFSRGSQFQLNDLVSGQEYCLYIVSVCGNQNISNPSDTVEFGSGGQPCPEAKSPRAESTTSTAANLTWDSVPGAVSYQVQYSEDGQSFQTVFAEANRIIIEALKPRTCYVYRIITICPGGSASRATESEFCTQPATGVCNRPASVQVEVRSETTAFIVWSPVAAARDYLVEISTDNQTFTPAAVSERSEILLENLMPNSSYFVRIRSRCGESELSDPTQPREFRTSTPCPVVEGLTLAELATDEAIVRWTAAVGTLRYEVWVQAGIEQPQLNQTVSSSQATIRPLTQASVYRVYIVTVCSEGRKSNPSPTLEFETQRPDCPTPRDIQVSNIDQRSAQLSWTAVPGATAYRVSMSNNEGQTYDLIFTSSTHAGFIAQPLEAATNYLVRVQAICANDLISAPSQPKNFRTLQGFSCPPPVNVSVSQITSASAFVSWPRVIEAVQYEITYTSPGGSQTLPRQAATSVLLNNLTPQTNYVVIIRSICANDSLSGSSNPREFITLASPPCPAPREISITLPNPTTASISWSSVQGALSYQVVLYDRQQSIIREWISPSTITEVQNLQPGTLYFAAVRSICTNQVRSELSELQPFETPVPAECRRPSNLEVVSRTQTTVVVEWSPVSGAVAYEVSVSRDGGNSFQAAITQLPRAEFSDLATSDVLILRVRTLCTGERFSIFTDPIEVRPAAPTDCPAPEGIEIGSLTPTTAFVSWPPIAGASAYEVSYETTTGWVKLNLTQRTNQLIQNLLPGTTYRVRVRTVCSDGRFSNPTEPRPFTTPQQAACNSPASISASRIESNLMRLNWPRVTGAVGYEVAFSSDGGNTFSIRITQDTLLVISNLQGGVNYVIRIRTLCSGNVYSDPVFNEFRTLLPNECPAPRNIRIEEWGVNFLLVRWDAVPGVTRYQIEYRRVGSTNYISLAPAVDLMRELVNLTPEDTFEIRVRSICGDQSQNVSIYTDPVIGITDPLPQSCPEVTQLFFPNVRSDRAVIEWNIPQGQPQPISYEILFSRDGGQSFETLTAFTNRIEVDRLQPNTTYFVRIRSVCTGDVRSIESSTGTFATTSEDICPVPVPVIAQLTHTQTTISWPRIFGAILYEISSASSPNGPFGNTQYTQDTSWVYSNLRAGDTLHVRIRAACSLLPSLFSNFSAILQITIPQAFCAAPTELAIINIGSNSAVVEWPRSTSSIANGYRVLISGDGGRTYDTLTTTSNRLQLRDLKPATIYLLRVATLCLGSRVSDDVGGDFQTLRVEACTTPQNLLVNNITSNSAEVSWNSVPGALGYQLAYKETQSQFFTTVTLNVPMYSIPGLIPESRYLVQVRAICDSSSSPYTPWTDQYYFETKPFVLVCPAPTSIDVRPGQTSATISWPAIPNATSYLVAYGEATALNLLSINVPINQITLTNLRPNTIYKVRIRVTCGADRSVFTPTVQFTTLAPRVDAGLGDEFTFTLYPNPARLQAHVRYESLASSTGEIILMDITGKLVYRNLITPAAGLNEWNLPLEGLSGGLYVVLLEIDGKRSMTKLWIQD